MLTSDCTVKAVPFPSPAPVEADNQAVAQEILLLLVAKFGDVLDPYLAPLGRPGQSDEDTDQQDQPGRGLPVCLPVSSYQPALEYPVYDTGEEPRTAAGVGVAFSGVGYFGIGDEI